MEKEQFTIVNENEHDLIGEIQRGKKVGKHPCIIFSPGLMDTAKSNYIKKSTKKFLDEGWAVLSFDYTQSYGESGGKPEDTTITQRSKDLKRVIEYAKRRSYIKDDKIVVFGHCYGAMTALFMEGFEHMLAGLILISTPARIENTLITRKDQRELMKIKLKRYFHVIHEDMNQEVRINYFFLEDGVKLDMDRAARNLKTPTLFIHGKNDQSIPTDDSKRMFDRAVGPKEYLDINMEHEIKGAALTKIFTASLEFLKKNKIK